MATAKNAAVYDEDSISALEGLEAVRHRPGMYIGEMGAPAHSKLKWEAIDNALDESLAGRNSHCQTGNTKDGWVLVHDGGQGIPVGMHKTLKKSTLEVIFTMLHAGGKFNSKAYSASRGTHGVGNKAITALSDELHVYTCRDGQWHTQSYSRGKKTNEVHQATEDDLVNLQWYADNLPWPDSVWEGGTLLAWKADISILGKAEVDEDWEREYLSTIALLNSGLYTALKDRKGVVHEWHNDNGPEGYLQYYADQFGYKLDQVPLVIYDKKKKFKKWEKRPNEKTGVLEEVEVEVECRIDVALQITDNQEARVWGYTNCGFNSHGGNHVAAFWYAFHTAIMTFAEKTDTFTDRDLQSGLLGYINWGMSEPQFSSQTKERLTSKVDDEVWELVYKDILKFLTDNPETTGVLIERARILAEARANSAGTSAMAAALKKKAGERGDGLPENMQRCTKTPVELFIVEGDSAAGHAKYARNSDNQEVLPLRGKVTNLEVNGLQAGLTEKSPVLSILKAIQFDPKKFAATGVMKLRHDRVFITADADPDGQHITLLVLGALWLLVPQMITDGRVFIVDSPLYLAIHNGKEVTAVTLDGLLEQLPKNYNSENIVRAKGLGELTPEWMEYTVFQPATRKIRRVTPPDSAEAEAWLAAMMGKDAWARKNLLGMNGDDDGGEDE